MSGEEVGMRNEAFSPQGCGHDKKKKEREKKKKRNETLAREGIRFIWIVFLKKRASKF